MWTWLVNYLHLHYIYIYNLVTASMHHGES